MSTSCLSARTRRIRHRSWKLTTTDSSQISRVSGVEMPYLGQPATQGGFMKPPSAHWDFY